jgi:hypothetical protein
MVVENKITTWLLLKILFISWSDVIFFISSTKANTAYGCESLKVMHPYLRLFTCQFMVAKNIQHEFHQSDRGTQCVPNHFHIVRSFGKH